MPRGVGGCPSGAGPVARGARACEPGGDLLNSILGLRVGSALTNAPRSPLPPKRPPDARFGNNHAPGSTAHHLNESQYTPVANIKSQIKRNKTNEKARERNKAVKTELKSLVRKTRDAVAAGLAEKCTIQVSYAIGVSKPLSVYFDLHGTGRDVDEAKLAAVVQDAVNLSPRGIRAWRWACRAPVC